MLYGTNGRCVMAGTTTDVACTTFRGGLYDPLLSTTRGAPSAGSVAIDGAPFPAMSYFTHTLRLTADASLSDFPIGLPLNGWDEQGYHPKNALGLGANSSVLGALRASGRIASRTWSMFWGRDGGTRAAQQDGLMVFGGYDRATVVGQRFVQSLMPGVGACPSQMVVTVTDMVPNSANGHRRQHLPLRRHEQRPLGLHSAGLPGAHDAALGAVLQQFSGSHKGNGQGAVRWARLLRIAV